MEEEKTCLDILKEEYSQLGSDLFELEVLKLDLDYSENQEIDFLKRSYNCWQESKKELLLILEKVDSNWENKFEPTSKGYFG
jgi:hypothetical protein